MKKLFLKSFALVAMLLCGLTASAEPKQYCAEEVTPTAGETTNQTLVFTASKTGDMETTFTLTSTTSTLTGLYEAVFQVSGGGVVSSADENYWKDWTLSDNTLTKVVTWSTYPTAAIQLHLVARRDQTKGGSDIIGYTFTDIDVSKTCSTGSGEEKETIKPTMTSASLVEESVTYNSVVIKVAGTDKETKEGDDVAVTRFKVLETSKTYTATDGKITITGLTPGTTYSFTIYAVDAAGNVSKEGLTVEATTSADAPIISGTCSGKRSDKSDGYDFTNPYNYTFTTSGYEDNASVLVEFTFNDTKVGVVAYLWMNHSGFKEVQMAYDGTTKKASYTIENLKKDDVIKVAVKFAYDGGMSVTSYIEYTVGTSCEAVVDKILPTMGEASVVSVSFNSAIISVSGTDKETEDGQEVAVTRFKVVYGKTEKIYTATDGKITITGLTAGTEYSFSIYAVDAAGNESTNKATVPDVKTLPYPAAPAAPVHAKDKVFSIYSDAYTSTVTRVTGSWGQQTKEQEVALAERDNAFFYTNCNFLGWELNGSTTIGDMSLFPNLHMDIYVPEAGSIKFTPIWGTEAAKEYSLVQGWNALDIDLAADFANINLKNIIQLKWDAMPAVCFIDNVYFWKNGTSTQLDGAAVATKVSKMIENGQVVIIREGVKYDVTGRAIER